MSLFNSAPTSGHRWSTLTNLSLWRKRFWHVRHGGWKQLREFERRRPNLPSFVPLQGKLGFFSRRNTDSFPEWPLPDPAGWKQRRNMTVGIIADTFTLTALAYEWKQIELNPQTWRDQLSETPLRMLFVESAWQGNGGQWRYQMTGSQAPSQALKDLVRHCQDYGIPTVFWNKEDPLHFDDFIDTAALFDHVFTTDADMIPRYQKTLGHQRVYLMQFAAQPAIHNPIRLSGHHTTLLRDVAFAGSYYRHKFPERRAQLDMLLTAADAVAPQLTTGFDIFARSAQESENYAFPKEYEHYIRHELSFPQMLSANHSYKVLLNANSVTASETMCARRIFEATASGACVLGVENPAVTKLFPPSEIIQVTSREEASNWITALCHSEELRDRMIHLAQRRIWRDHTYAHRINDMLDAIGSPSASSLTPEVSAMVSTNRPQQMSHLLHQLSAQEDVNCEPIILTHGFTPDRAMRELAKKLGLAVTWLEEPASTPLGECYNRIITQASCEFIAKMDDDDLYGPHYLFDQISALRYSNADLVGKGAHYIYLENLNCLALRFPHLEHRYNGFVVGASILTRTDVLRQTRFSPLAQGEDSRLLTEIKSQGGIVYASNRFGFVVRRSLSSHHTWQIADAQVLASSKVTGFGHNFDSAIF